MKAQRSGTRQEVLRISWEQNPARPDLECFPADHAKEAEQWLQLPELCGWPNKAIDSILSDNCYGRQATIRMGGQSLFSAFAFDFVFLG